MTKQLVTLTRTETVEVELDVPQQMRDATIVEWANGPQSALNAPLGVSGCVTRARTMTDWTVRQPAVRRGRK